MKKFMSVLLILLLITSTIPSVFADNLNYEATEKFIECLEDAKWNYRIIDNDGKNDVDYLVI